MSNKPRLSYSEDRKLFSLDGRAIDSDTAISLLDSAAVKWEVGASLRANKIKSIKIDDKLDQQSLLATSSAFEL